MENLGAIISKYWGFILFLLGLCFHAIWTYFQVGEHSKRLEKLENRADNSDTNHSRFESLFSEINAKLDILLEGYNTKKK